MVPSNKKCLIHEMMICVIALVCSTMFHLPSDDFSRSITSKWDGMDYAEKRKPIFKLRSNKNVVAEWH
ncbi:hypothetical protein Peur_028526 [Populus x canadensis]